MIVGGNDYIISLPNKNMDISGRVSEYKTDNTNPNKQYYTSGPMRTLGTALGTGAGFYFGGPMGSAVGSYLGNAVGGAAGYLTGTGDYVPYQKKMKRKYGLRGHGDYKMGDTPQYNAVWNSSRAPKFAAKGRTNVITNREYLGDVKGSATAGQFQVSQYSVNPGQSNTFPWLATIAQNYEQYRISGIIFEFKSTVGENSGVQNVGTVILGTEYNVNTSPFPNKQQMENSQFAQSAKSVESQIHGLECASKDRPVNIYYVRTGAMPANDNLKWYDFANFQIATLGLPANQVVGELWVSYNIEFYKPQLPVQLGGYSVSNHTVRTANIGANMWGAGLVSSSGTTTIPNSAVTDKALSVALPINTTFMLSIYWYGTATINNVSFDGTAGAQVGYITKPLFLGAVADKAVGCTANASTTASLSRIFTVTDSLCTFTLTGVIPGGSQVEVWITTVDQSVTA